MDDLLHFLLVYEASTGELLRCEEFADAAVALAAFEAAEQAWREETDSRVVITLIGSDSLDTVKKTHPNFFGDMAGQVHDALLGAAK